jgi:hypothetical protein
MSTELNKKWAALTADDQELLIFTIENGVAGFVGTTLAYIEEGQADDYLQDILDTATTRLSIVDPTLVGEVDADPEGEQTTATPTTRASTHKLGSPTEIELGGMKFKVGSFYRWNSLDRSAKAGSVWKVTGRGNRGTVRIVAQASGARRGRGSVVIGSQATINAETAQLFPQEVFFSKCKGHTGPDGKPAECTASSYPNYGGSETWVVDAEPGVIDSLPEQCDVCKAEDAKNQGAIDLAARRDASKMGVEEAIQRRRQPKPEPSGSGGGRRKPSVVSAQMASKQQPTPSVVVPTTPIGLRGVRRGGSDR